MKLFDPIDLAARTEKIVCKGNTRRYLRFGTTPDYGKGVATGYTAGCNIRCVFCAASHTRDNPDMANRFYSPEEVFHILYEIVKKHRKINVVRISDGEPTIGREHLLELIEHVEKSDIRKFYLETNGTLLGNDESYVRDLSRFRKVVVRVSLKGGTPETFSKISGSVPEAFELPFQAIRNIYKYKVDCQVSAMVGDPRMMDPLERISLISRLGIIDPALVLKLHEEFTILFPNAIKRLEATGWNNGNMKRPFYLRGPLGKFVQVSYVPARSILKTQISFGNTIKNIIQLRHGI
jgi:uncharacterized Fe-S cluster-containing radical SAM superfamily protein